MATPYPYIHEGRSKAHRFHVKPFRVNQDKAVKLHSFITDNEYITGDDILNMSYGSPETAIRHYTQRTGQLMIEVSYQVWKKGEIVLIVEQPKRTGRPKVYKSKRGCKKCGTKKISERNVDYGTGLCRRCGRK